MSPRAGLRLLIEDFDAAPKARQPSGPFCPCPRCEAAGRAGRCPSDAYDDGVRAGEERLAAGDSEHAVALAAEFAAALDRVDGQIAVLADHAADAMGRAVIAMVAAVLPASFGHLAAGESRAIAAAVLPALASEPAIDIEAAPASLAAIREAVGLLPRASQARIAIQPRETAHGAELHITWSNGAIRQDLAAALARVCDTLARFGLEAPKASAPPELKPVPQPTRMEAHAHG